MPLSWQQFKGASVSPTAMINVLCQSETAQFHGDVYRCKMVSCSSLPLNYRKGVALLLSKP
jgi:hypothetical protein